MEPFKEQLLEVFKLEIAELLDKLTQIIEVIRTQDGPARAEALHEFFRIAHNMKGAANSVGNDAIETIAHVMEDIVVPLKKKNQKPNASTLNLLLKAITTIQYLVENRRPDKDPEALIRQLQSLETTVLETSSNEQIQAVPVERAARLKKRKKGSVASDDVLSPEGASPVDQTNQIVPAGAQAFSPGTKHEQDSVPSPGDSTVRIRTERLDDLMAYAGELLISRARLQTRSDSLHHFQDEIIELIDELPYEVKTPFNKISKDLSGLVQHDQKELMHFG